MKTKYECRACHGTCDPGELVQGLCPECTERTQDPGNVLTEGKAKGLGQTYLQDRSLKQSGKE